MAADSLAQKEIKGLDPNIGPKLEKELEKEVGSLVNVLVFDVRVRAFIVQASEL